jgi:pseudaminic acid cytidylyltransferase
MNIAIVPARGGSKRVPRKNIKEFSGRPMIAYAIVTACKSGLFEHVVVSTDDEEIARIARGWGAETPFTRPVELADDSTGTVPVIAHAIQEMNAKGVHPDYVCCIYPCVPFLTCKDLSAGLETLVSADVDFVYPVTEYPHPIQRAMRRTAGGKMEFLFPEHELSSTHTLEKTFHDTGQFYWGKAKAWLAHGRMHSDGLGMVIPKWRVVDIDTDDDWRRAELLFKVLRPAPSTP